MDESLDMKDAKIWAEVWKVDEVIEAVEYSKAGISDARWHEIERTLLDLAPTAYCGLGVMLISIWKRIPEDMRRDMYRAYLADHWPKGMGKV